MVLALIAIVGGVKWLTHIAVTEWIPDSLIGYVAVGLLAFGAGLIVGERSALKSVNTPTNGRR